MADASFGEARQSDFDSGAGTDLVEVTGIVVPASGGAVVVGGILETGTSAFGALGVGGGTPHDSVDSGNPVKIGGVASNAAPTGVSADGDRVAAWYGRLGSAVVSFGPLTPGSDSWANSSITGVRDVGASGNVAILMTAGHLFNGTTWDRPRSGGVTGMAGVSGDTAHAAVDAGNPLKIGGVANSSIPSTTGVADGDRVNAWYSFHGAAATVLADYTGGNTAAISPAIGDSMGFFGALQTVAFPVLYTGSTYIRARSTPGVTGAAAVGGLTASDAVLAAAPATIGGRASTAVPTAVSADGDVVDARFLRTGALTVHVVDAAGAAASMGGGTQYVGDAAATATPTGTIAMGLANASAPTDVSANNDAVAAWYLRSGAQATVLTAAGALIGGDATGGLHIQGAIANDAVDSGNAVKIGGRASSAEPTAVSADGDRVNAWFNQVGALAVQFGVAAVPVDANNFATISHAMSSAGAPKPLLTTPVLFNGTGSTYDRHRTTQGVIAGANTDLGIATAGIGPGFARIPAVVAATGATTATVSGKGASQVVFDVAGTFTGFAATVQVSYDGTTYLTANTNQSYIDGLGVTAFGTAIAATAVVGRVLVNTWGAQSVRLNITAVASGTANVTATANAIGAIPAASVGGGTQYVGDAAATATPTGTIAMGLANAAAPTDVSANADAVAAWYLRNGAQAVNLTAAGALIGGDATGGLHVQGAIAHDAVDSGRPLKIGGHAYANGTSIVAAAAGDRVDAAFNLYGQLHVAATGAAGGADAVANTLAYPFDDTGARFPMSAAGLNFNGTTWDRQRAIAALDAAPNVDTGVLAAGIGPGFDRKRDPAGVAATSTSNAVTVVVDGAASMMFHVTTIGTTPGSMILEFTGDDANWVTATGVVKIGIPPTFITGAFVPAVNDMYMVPTQGIRQVRYRVNAVYASGTATVKVTGSQSAWYSRAGVQGVADHDAVGTGSNPILMGGYASAAAPTAVSADNDAVQAWYLRNGAQVKYEVGAGTNASSQVTISNTSATIIAARTQRKGVLITNKQTVGVSIDFSGGSAVYATHYVLDPGASMFWPGTNAVTGITSAAYTATGDAKLHLVEVY